MKGRSPIVLAIHSEGFKEHPDLDSAEKEAARLVAEAGVLEAVVYVPKRIVRAEVVTEHIRGNGRKENRIGVHGGPLLSVAQRRVSVPTPVAFEPECVATGA